MNKPAVIIETNVPLTANGAAEHADVPCVQRCLQELITTMRERRLLLDNTGFILLEYLKQKPHGFPQGAGDLFMVWASDNQANPAHVRIVPITPLEGNPQDFAEFPLDPDLQKFDLSDRKFVAVALASGERLPILNATDTDWWHAREAFTRNGVNIVFLCENLMTKQG